MAEKKFSIKDYVPGKSMYIKASAGTGKTYTIQQLVARLIAGDAGKNIEMASLENIVIVTYTEKATGELRDRIRSKITEVIETKRLYDESPLITEEQLKHFENELRNIDNAPIYTIHGWCKHVLDQYAFTAGFPFKLENIDEGESEAFFDKWLRDSLKDDRDFQELFDSADNREGLVNSLKSYFMALLKKMYYDRNGKINPELIDVPEECFEFDGSILNTEQSLKLSCPDSAEDLFVIDGYEDNYSIIEDLEKSGNEKAEKLKNAIDAYIAAKRPKDVFSGSTIRDSSYSKLKDSDPELYEAYAYFKNLKDVVLKNAAFPDVNAIRIIQFCLKKLPEFYKKWKQEKADRKVQTFNDMINNVYEAITEEDSLLKKELQKQYRYAIIDEFQDTNQKQWNIFKTVFGEDERHCVIVVGDPKQSIYSFQETDVAVFNKALKELEKSGADCCTLDTNYRSSDLLVEACNELFRKDFFSEGNCEFTPSDSCHKIKNAQFCGGETKPFWFVINGKDEGEEIPEEEKTAEKIPDDNEVFAETAVKCIIECCSDDPDNPGKTKLQINDKKTKELRNVTFSDFAILGTAGWEFEKLEKEMASAGIPFIRYKDESLFSGSECKNWIALFNAIAAPDFSSARKKLLSEALFTDFFDFTLDELKDSRLDEPTCPERQRILKWNNLAEKRQWAKLLEAIFRDSGIETRLSTFEKLQSLSKYRQIGSYAVNYLYKRNCSIADLVTNLKELSKGEGEAEEDGKKVAKGTDFNCVNLLTIHASKGLDFPIVICAGGIGSRHAINDVEIYHENDRAYLSVFDYGRNKCNIEKQWEWERLFYVAYTRAQSLMILPYFNSWKDNEDMHFLLHSTSRFCASEGGCHYWTEAKEILHVMKNWNEYKAEVQKILNGLSVEKNEGDRNRQYEVLKVLSEKIPELKTKRNSYSSLSHGNKKDDEILPEYKARIDEEDEVPPLSIREYDENAKQIDCNYDRTQSAEINSSYPAGTKLGLAVHKVFELIDFRMIEKIKGLSEAEESTELKDLVRKCFVEENFRINSIEAEQWIKTTAGIVWNTLNAQLPEIKGSKSTDRNFCLKEISLEQRLSEIEFNFNPMQQKWFKNYLNGFIDLLFVRETEGKKIYSIVDWKTNSFAPEDFSDGINLKKDVDELFSIQRVLYSYTLIKWLCQFGNRSEEEVFEESFGGIYYVMVRGCKAETGNGIYAQTWNSWNDLKESYDKICSELMH